MSVCISTNREINFILLRTRILHVFVKCQKTIGNLGRFGVIEAKVLGQRLASQFVDIGVSTDGLDRGSSVAGIL